VETSLEHADERDLIETFVERSRWHCRAARETFSSDEFRPGRRCSRVRALRNIGRRLVDHSGLMFAARITLPQNSVSAAMNFPNSTAPIGIGTWPFSLIRALTLASMRPALISRLSVSTISAGAPRGATIPTP